MSNAFHSHWDSIRVNLLQAIATITAVVLFFAWALPDVGGIQPSYYEGADLVRYWYPTRFIQPEWLGHTIDFSSWQQYEIDLRGLIVISIWVITMIGIRRRQPRLVITTLAGIIALNSFLSAVRFAEDFNTYGMNPESIRACFPYRLVQPEWLGGSFTGDKWIFDERLARASVVLVGWGVVMFIVMRNRRTHASILANPELCPKSPSPRPHAHDAT